MTVTQEVDLAVNALGFSALFWLSAATVIRWIRKGRVECYSVESLLPKGLPSWMRWLLAATCVIAPASSSPGFDSRDTWGITPWGWLYFGCIAVWLLVKAV